MATSVDTNLRIDQELVNLSEPKALGQMQCKLNQWITAGTLVKYEIVVVSPTLLLYNVCRKKGAE